MLDMSKRTQQYKETQDALRLLKRKMPIVARTRVEGHEAHVYTKMLYATCNGVVRRIGRLHIVLPTLPNGGDKRVSVMNDSSVVLASENGIRRAHHPYVYGTRSGSVHICWGNDVGQAVHDACYGKDVYIALSMLLLWLQDCTDLARYMPKYIGEWPLATPAEERAWRSTHEG